MPVYPEPIASRLAALKYAGEPLDANAEGRAVNFDCGGFIAVQLQVSDDEGIVTDARFRSNGCGFMVAAADAICSSLEGASLGDLHGLGNLDAVLFTTFGVPAAGRAACFESVTDAVREAFADHRRRRIEEFSGEKALICTCFGVSEETVVRFIENARPASVEEVSDTCRAGSGCGSCRMLIQELLDVSEMESSTSKP